jgi:ATP-dependent exoDNAse (exonuclease V) alpha subunit
MADHGSSTFTGPETPEQLLADRRRMLDGFLTGGLVTAILTAVILILMGIFLL